MNARIIGGDYVAIKVETPDEFQPFQLDPESRWFKCNEQGWIHAPEGLNDLTAGA